MANYNPTTADPLARKNPICTYSNGVGKLKTPTMKEQITALQKEVDELRQEITVLKTLLPPPEYIYGMR
ncbi:MAG: hypothetical protein PHG06_00475 [Parabacteroides sp.]|nr:hypothetical protein [Parabacteroides sp.]